MRVLGITLLALAFMMTSLAYAGPAEEPGFQEYGGAINGNLNITMLLERKGNVIEGEYFYENQPASLKLKGEMTSEQDFILQEYDRDKNTGIFTGAFLADGRMAGQWSNPAGTVQYDFSLTKKATSPWAGKWSRAKYYFSPATLQIWNVDENGFDFRLSAASGGNMGFIGFKGRFERANFTGDRAGAAYETKQGRLEFRLQGDALAIEQTGSVEAGLGVVYSGEYHKGEVIVVPPTLVKHKVFHNAIEEETFRALVGEDYETFLKSFHLVSEQKDLDQVGALVYCGGVRGLFTIMEGIIMTTPGGEMWAAITQGKDVHYYTNSKRFDGLPKTIENWRERFKTRKVIMTYKPSNQE